jgi:O-antigen/teichoic acid export membrane protein
MIEGRRLAKNTMWNLIGQAGPLVVAVVAVPIVLRALGAERFGILTMAWAAVGYFNLFDFGLPRVLTQALSAALEAGDRKQLSTISQAGLLMMLLLGVLGGIVMSALTPWLVHSALKVPAGLRGEASASFYLLAACLPFVVTTSGLRGIIEAHQDFGISAGLRLPYAAFNYIAPLLTITVSHSLVPIVTLLLVGRVLTWIAHVVICFRRYDYLRASVPLGRAAFAPLVRLGGWMTMSNVISPLMYNIDRFVIGGALSLTAVTYYVTPFELVTKLLLIPGAFIGVLFPAFAAAHVRDSMHANDLFERGLRLMGVIMFPLALVVIAFAPQILRLWVGSEVAAHGSRVAQWLALGIFVNSLAQIPFTVLQASGRPDLTAKLHAVELPVYATALWLFTRRLGVEGVAEAWTLRIVIDATMLFVLVAIRSPEVRKSIVGPFRVLAPLAMGLVAPMFFVDGEARAMVATICLVVAGFLVWHRGLRSSEKTAAVKLLRAPFAARLGEQP